MLKKLKRYTIEITLLTIAFVIAFISILIIINQNNLNKSTDDDNISLEKTNNLANIYIDVSGAVNKPGLYQLKSNSRLKQALDAASGFSDEADTSFFYRNFNLARILSDQEKIYIPSIQEINNNIFTEETRILNYISPKNITSDTLMTIPSENNNESILININQSDIEELDTLPGIGKVTAQKIIDNRSYTNIDDLLNKKIVNQSVFEKIKDLIAI